MRTKAVLCLVGIVWMITILFLTNRTTYAKQKPAFVGTWDVSWKDGGTTTGECLRLPEKSIWTIEFSSGQALIDSYFSIEQKYNEDIYEDEPIRHTSLRDIRLPKKIVNIDKNDTINVRNPKYNAREMIFADEKIDDDKVNRSHSETHWDYHVKLIDKDNLEGAWECKGFKADASSVNSPHSEWEGYGTFTMRRLDVSQSHR